MWRREEFDHTVDGVMEKELKQDTFRSDLFLEEAIEYVDMVSKMVLS